MKVKVQKFHLRSELEYACGLECEDCRNGIPIRLLFCVHEGRITVPRCYGLRMANKELMNEANKV